MLGLFLAAAGLPEIGFAQQSLELEPVHKWLERMDETKSVEATFVQQKYLRTLRRPLTTSGHFWLRHPDAFRWEIGEPPSTVAIRNEDSVMVLKPRKKRVERYSLKPDENGNDSSLPASFRSVSKSFPRSMEELEKHFDILGIERGDKNHELALKPKDKKLTAAMRQVVFFINAEKYYLAGFEIQFRDKSRIRTTFTKIKFNPVIPNDLLKPDLEGYEESGRSK